MNAASAWETLTYYLILLLLGELKVGDDDNGDGGGGDNWIVVMARRQIKNDDVQWPRNMNGMSKADDPELSRKRAVFINWAQLQAGEDDETNAH